MKCLRDEGITAVVFRQKGTNHSPRFSGPSRGKSYLFTMLLIQICTMQYIIVLSMTTSDYTCMFVIWHLIIVSWAWHCTSGKERRGSVVFGERGVWQRNKRRLNLPIDRYGIDVLMHNAFCSVIGTAAGSRSY